jgi:hypothetical protein
VKPRRPIDAHDDAGPGNTARAPMHCVPRHFFGGRQQVVEAAVGREKYAEILYHASYESARHWCDREAGTHGLSGMAVLEHYLRLLSRRGWGNFSLIEADAASGSADIRLDHSAFTLAQAQVCGAKICYRFAGWFAGMMDWISENSGRPVRTLCCETQCGAEGHGCCIFAVRPRAAN